MEATDLINWRKVSIFLTGKPENIRSTYDREKYKKEVEELKAIVKEWMEKRG